MRLIFIIFLFSIPVLGDICVSSTANYFNSKKLNEKEFVRICKAVTPHPIEWSPYNLIKSIEEVDSVTKPVVGSVSDLLAISAYLETGFKDPKWVSQLNKTLNPKGLGSFQINPIWFNSLNPIGSSLVRRIYMYAVFESTTNYGAALAYLIHTYNKKFLINKVHKRYKITNRDVLLVLHIKYVSGTSMFSRYSQFVDSLIFPDKPLKVGNKQSAANLARTLKYAADSLVLMGDEPSKGKWDVNLVRFMNKTVIRKGSKPAKVWKYVFKLDPNYKKNAIKRWRDFNKYYKIKNTQEFLDKEYASGV